MGKKICRYTIKIHRSSDVGGVFILTDDHLEIIKNMEDNSFYYGELAGKHSEVSAELDYDDIEILSDKKEEVEFFERIFPHGTGFDFPYIWFERSVDEAYNTGYDSASNYETSEEALVENNEYNNSVTKKSFIKGFKDGKEDNLNSN